MAVVIAEMVVQDEAALARAMDEFHDWWLDLDAVKLQETTRNVRIPFWRDIKRAGTTEHDKCLVIAGAIALRIHDTERIGYYDLNTLSLQGDTVMVECGVPLRIEIVVDWERSAP